VAGPYPLSFLAAILNMIAGLVDVSMCAACRLEAGTMHCALLPQKTRTKASWLGEEDTVLVGPAGPEVVAADFTARYTEYSMMSPVENEGGSQLRCAPPSALEILMAEGAPGKPGMQVLKAETSDHAPRPQVLMPATRNLYAVPGWRSIFLSRLSSASFSRFSSDPSSLGK